MKYSLVFSLLLLVLNTASAQPSYKGVVRSVEPCECQVKVDSSFTTHCAYLIVPENRRSLTGKMIKLPFIRVESKNPNKRKDPVLYTGGGPGSSSLGFARGVVQSEMIRDRDGIAFEQRGTYYAIPRLASSELSDAIRESYRQNLDKDSMYLVGTKRYKEAMQAQGIDLSGYNTDETVADIADLLATLGIDSVNLSGGSYSGGLMMAVLKNDPSHVRSLVLNSPLPTFVPIDEDEPANFMESLNIIFDRIEKDSLSPVYTHLRERFLSYFNSIIGKTFYISYQEKDAKTPGRIAYTKNELLDQICGSIYASNIQNIAVMIADIVDGKHEKYIRGMLDGIFSRQNGPNAMRISVYCADQTAYHSEAVLQSLYNVYPFLNGFHINDVYKEMCNCWQVPPIHAQTKQPFYSSVPALLSDGLLDNACRPLYIDRIRHYLPNSQCIVFLDMAHMVGDKPFDHTVASFLNHPFQKISTESKHVIVY